jgi:hypothetical protein
MKKKSKNQDGLQHDLKFCTECNDQLDEFCFSGTANDKEFIKRNHEKCRKTGKFKGDVCSKLYIVSDNDIDEIILNDE